MSSSSSSLTWVVRRLLYSQALLLLLTTHTQVVVHAQPQACTTDSTVTGFDTIAGLNAYMGAVWQLVNSQAANAPQSPFYFFLCPQTTFTDSVIFPRLNDTYIVCGGRGSLDDGCVLGGEDNHILLSDPQHQTEPLAPRMEMVTFAGLSMSNSKSNSVQALGKSYVKAVFYNCLWLNNMGNAAIYLSKVGAELTGMALEVHQSVFLNNVFSTATILNNGGSLLVLNSSFLNLVNAYGVITNFNGIVTTVGFCTFTKTNNYATLLSYGGMLALKEVEFVENENSFATVYVSQAGNLQASNCTFTNNENGVSNGILDGNSALILNELNTGTGPLGITDCAGFVTVNAGTFCSKELGCAGTCCAYTDATCDLTGPAAATPSPTTSSPTEAPPSCPELDPALTYYCPVARYCPWDTYSRADKDTFVSAMGHSLQTWNYIVPSTHEQLRFANLDDTTRDAYTALGYTEQRFDCCNNHYADYAWSDFDRAAGYENVLYALEVLGHTEATWNQGNTATMYDGMAWAELPQPVREAAQNALCYNEQLWNQVVLPWPDDAVLPNGHAVTAVPTRIPTRSPVVGGTWEPSVRASVVPTAAPIIVTKLPTATPTASPKPTFKGCRPKFDGVEYFCPFDRYCEWDYYPLGRRNEFRTEIGYGEDDWNFVLISPVEQVTFSTLSPQQQGGLANLGFDEDRHDCCLNHYNDYDWGDFDPEYGFQSVLDALETLGYNEVMWQNGISAAYERFGWDDLPEQVQWSAMELCYSKETWDQIELTEWSLNADLPGIYEVVPGTLPNGSPDVTGEGGGNKVNGDGNKDVTNNGGGVTNGGGTRNDSTGASPAYCGGRRLVYAFGILCVVLTLL